MAARIRTMSVMHQPGTVVVEAAYLAKDQVARWIYHRVKDEAGAYAHVRTPQELRAAMGEDGWAQVLVGLTQNAQTGQAIDAALSLPT